MKESDSWPQLIKIVDFKMVVQLKDAMKHKKPFIPQIWDKIGNFLQIMLFNSHGIFTNFSVKF